MRSDKPQARQFQDWVTREVLPAIRKNGAYVMGEEKVLSTGEMSEDELVLKALSILRRGRGADALGFPCPYPWNRLSEFSGRSVITRCLPTKPISRRLRRPKPAECRRLHLRLIAVHRSRNQRGCILGVAA